MSAAAFLQSHRALAGVRGVDAVYWRGTDSVPLRVVLGRTSHDVADAQGVVTTWQSQDALVEASTLRLGGALAVPERGDEIRIELAGVVTVFRVQFPDPNQPPFRFSDPHRQILRIHAAEIGTSLH